MDELKVQSEVTLCEVSMPGDLELILAWRSNPEIYKWFYQQKGPLKWEDHVRFWTEKKDRKDWIIHYNGRKVGSVFVVFNQDVTDVGIYIGETTLWHKGVGKRGLELAVDWLRKNNCKEAQARINKDNTSSKILFEKVGFQYQGDWAVDGHWYLYKIEL